MKHKELIILKHNGHYWAPLFKKRKLYAPTPVLLSLDKFRNYINEELNRFGGEILLQDDKGSPFIRFRLNGGKMSKIYKTSPVTGKIYPIWRRMC